MCVQFVSDVTKYISGCMASLSAMIQLELPHINVLTKVDLLPNKRDIDRWGLDLIKKLKCSFHSIAFRAALPAR